MSTIQQSYTEMPYPIGTHPPTHIDRLATIATLTGLSPASVTQCRVLEIGCASGGNLMPMAYQFPHSQFTGIDLVAKQIELGQALLAESGLENVTLQTMDILEVTPDLGEFDYIIAHGVYSWVPAEVRDKLMQVCKQNLDPKGIAYISYNVYPGWYLIRLIRETLLYHTRHADDPWKRIAEARAFLEFMGNNLDSTKMHVQLFKLYHKLIGDKDNEFIMHDELSEYNTPLYFHEFMTHAEQHGLQYVGEADFNQMFPHDLSQAVTQKIGQSSRSRIEMEQYFDFMRDNSFRRTLLTHAEVPIQMKLNPEIVSKFYVMSKAKPASDAPDIHAKSVETFLAAEDSKLSIDHPVTKAAMLYLQAVSPRFVPFETLLAEAQAHIYPDGLPDAQTQATDRQVLAVNLLKAYSYHITLAELRTQPAADFTPEVSDLPVANPVVRAMARHYFFVANSHHDRLQVDGICRYVLQRLDGQHTPESLVDLLEKAVEDGRMKVAIKGEDIKGNATARDILVEEVKQQLEWLAKWSLLER